MRSASAARLGTLRRTTRTTLPPLRSRLGVSPSQLTKSCSLGKRLMSVPISARMVCAVMTLMPSMVVRSTPQMRTS